jgi:tetratricopeptide (TPR) repeat protein
MSKSAGRGLQILLLGALGALGSFGLPASPAAGAEPGTASSQVVELTRPVQLTLKELQEQWLQWLGANTEERSRAGVDGLLATARQLEMARLPDLSAGALVQAVEAARAKDVRRARWSLAAAERLDPARPETSFAASRVAWLEKRPWETAGLLMQGVFRLWGLPGERSLWFQSLLLWGLTGLLLTGGLFVLAQMATKGGALLHDSSQLLGRWLPPGAALVSAVLALVWPLVLSPGLLWLLLFWSLLLWGYGSRSERAILVALWLLLGTAPLLLAAQRRAVGLALSPPVRALESLAQKRLYGSLFTDLGVLRSLAPDEVAVKQLLADVHRSLGQWELARVLYRQVLEKEPENAPALVNLGAYFFYKKDFGNAIQYFDKATKANPQSAEAWFNLSEALSGSYLFDQSRSALQRAQDLGGGRANAWIKGNANQQVVVLPGGLARRGEIRRALLARGEPRGEAPTPGLQRIRRGLALFVSLGLILAAAALHAARRSFGYTEPPVELRFSPRRLAFWGRIFLPGVASAEIGEGGRSFLALWIPVLCLLLPFFGTIGYRIPWGFDPGSGFLWLLAALGLLLYFAFRLRWELRNQL